ncbi:putative dihydroorotate reductase [Phaeomoniella chlamydospora]|uniref:Dihydroorotate dehydrogenase (quinone), mitochondrial n=1 Tax=Phaeomoniella chlamydospora TaxID=158046 RepID=A0A0G2GHV0_PHACM|nr:putative dihydroorotate reductase [Phaeomoniella chlamydospora]
MYFTDTRAAAHRYVIVPVIRNVFKDAEDAHHFGNLALKALYHFGLHPRERSDPDRAGDLAISVFGHTLVNPIATSGGLDKDADIPNPLFALGPAIVEVGGTTPRPQEGNPKPRVFRIPSQNAIINRYGLNSKGADHMATILRFRVREYAKSLGLGFDAEAEQRVLDGETGVPPGSLTPGRLLAVQVAKNKTTPESDVEAVKADYVYCVERLAKYADILVVNVSSPNTPGLRSLQATGPLTEILKSVVGAARKADRKTKPAVMVKVSPDEDSDEEVAGICEAVWASGVDGVIVGNTTKKRLDPLPRGYILRPEEEQILMEQGGYSGPQLFANTVKLVKKYRSLLDVRPPLSRPSYPPTSSDSNSKEEAAAAAPMPVPLSISDSKVESPAASSTEDAPKVIFATGGITTGKQALEVLNAGASVAMVYTALVYGGAGTISRIKEEMRDEINSRTKTK